MKKTGIVLIVFLLIIFHSFPGLAATSSYSTVSLSSMAFVITGDLTIDYGFWTDESLSAANALDTDETMATVYDENDNFDDTSVIVNISHANSIAQTVRTTSGQPLQLLATGNARADINNAFAATEAWSYFWFAVETGSTGGSITISADYDLEISLETDENQFAYAYADVQMGGDYDFDRDDDFEWDEVRFLEQVILGLDSFSDVSDGTLSVEMIFDANSVGEFWWEVEAYTAVGNVPVPSTLSLLGLGLLGLAGIKRRFS